MTRKTIAAIALQDLTKDQIVVEGVTHERTDMTIAASLEQDVARIRRELTARLLGLDVSSVSIGWSLVEQRRDSNDEPSWHEPALIAVGTYTMPDDVWIGERCLMAADHLSTILRGCQTDVDVIGIEDAVIMRRPGGKVIAGPAIQQSRVVGGMLAELCYRKMTALFVAPSEAKRALYGKGNASKDQMQRAARQRWPSREFTEHSADATGVALHLAGMIRSGGIVIERMS